MLRVIVSETAFIVKLPKESLIAKELLSSDFSETEAPTILVFSTDFIFPEILNLDCENTLEKENNKKRISSLNA